MALTAATDAVTPFGIETRNQRAGQSTISKSYATCSAFVLGMMVATIGLLAVQHYGIADGSLTKSFLAPAVPTMPVSGATGTSVGAHASTKKGHHLGKALPASIHQSIPPSRFQQKSMSLPDIEDPSPTTMSIDEKEPVRTHGYGTSDNAAVPAAKLQSSPLSLFTFSFLASSLLMIIIGGFLFLHRRRQTSDMGSMGVEPARTGKFSRATTVFRNVVRMQGMMEGAYPQQQGMMGGASPEQQGMMGGAYPQQQGMMGGASPQQQGMMGGASPEQQGMMGGAYPEQQGPKMPSDKQIAYASRLSAQAGEQIPAAAYNDSRECSTFIDQMLNRVPPSQNQLAFANTLAERAGVRLTPEDVRSSAAISRFIEQHNRQPQGAMGVGAMGVGALGVGALGVGAQVAPGAGLPSGGFVTTQIIGGPSDKQLAFAVNLARELKRGLSHGVISDKSECSAFIEELLAQKQADRVPLPSTNDGGQAGSVPVPGTDAISTAGGLFVSPFAEPEGSRYADDDDDDDDDSDDPLSKIVS